MRKIIGVSLAMVLLTSCSGTSLSGGSKSEKIEVQKNLLNGLPGTDNEIIVVKIDDTRQARPQTGIEDADVVYLEQVEGGATRIAALYSSKYPEVVGPVRSARISDIEIFAQYGKFGFAYSGAQQRLTSVINASNIFNMSAERFGYYEPYFRDESRYAPVNLYLNPNVLLEKAHAKDIYFEKANKSGWVFGSAASGGRKVLGVDFSWPAVKYGADWDKVSKKWLIRQNGEPKMAKSGTQLGADTLVVQLVAITDSEYGDKFGGVTPHSATIGTGKALIFRGGKVFDAIWNRPTATETTTWKDATGADIPFATGQIWIALVDKERLPTVIEPEIPSDATSPVTK
jgi:Protein of unknown function (DUF3048) N-terminal domain/Protein of unknown function (DUF3048) C-terminal domain